MNRSRPLTEWSDTHIMGTTSKRIYVYPGSFDPVTNGHLDIIHRAANLCDTLLVAVGHNREKKAMFSVEERQEMIRDAISETETKAEIVVTSFSGLLADFARQNGATVIVKGLRAMSDFEYEFQMALLNKHLDYSLETIFLTTNVKYTYLSSSAVKEFAENNAKLEGLIPDRVYEKIRRKIQKVGEDD